MSKSGLFNLFFLVLFSIVAILNQSFAETEGETKSFKERIDSIYQSKNKTRKNNKVNVASKDKNPINKLNNATVQIETFNRAGSKVGEGSGFIVDPKGVIVTNNHVIHNAFSVIVRLQNGDIYKEIVIRDYNEEKDLAIVKLNGFDLPTVDLGNSNKIDTGNKIIVCGNTLGEYENSMSTGIISGIRHNDMGYKYIQMTAPISPGNSGGPVSLESGEVIGVSVATRLDGQNVNFAVPINYVLGMLENNKNLSLEEYSGICGEQMRHITQAKPEKTFAHPDCDISKRVVIVPFSGFCANAPQIGTEIAAGTMLRFKENFKKENLFVVDIKNVASVLKETSGDSYDGILKTFDKKRAKEFAVKFRANTVVFGKVNHFESGLETVFVPFVGFTNVMQTTMNIEYNLYKLDQDKIIVKDKVRRKSDMNMPTAIIRVGSIIAGKIKKKYKEFCNSNKHKNKAIVVKLENSEAKVVLKN